MEYDIWTPKANQSFLQARIQSREFGHPYVGTEHVLLGVDRVSTDGVVRSILDEYFPERDLVPRVMDAVKMNPKTNIIGNLPFTPRSKKVLQLARDYSQSLRITHTGTEHILYGLLQEKEGVAAQVLTGNSLERRDEMMRMIDDAHAPVIYHNQDTEYVHDLSSIKFAIGLDLGDIDRLARKRGYMIVPIEGQKD